MERGRMNEDDEHKLQANIVFLKKNLNPNDILDHLLESKLISFEQQDEINCEKTASEKIDRLIKFLRFAGKDAFKIFIKCLQQSGYRFIAERLCQGSSNKTATENDSQVDSEIIKDVSEISKQSSATNVIASGHEIDSSHQNEADSFYPIDDKIMESKIERNTQKEATTPSNVIQHKIGSPVYEEIGDVSDLNYDLVDFAKSASGLVLKTPFDERLMEGLSLSNNVQLSTDPTDLPGWCPNINDSNRQKAVDMLDDGGYFFWYSKMKNAYIITLRTSQHKEGCIYVKVKTRKVGSEKLYRITRDIESTSPEKLFEHCIDNGLPLKFINK